MTSVGKIFEGEPFEPVGRAARVEGPADEIDALRMIFMVNERAMFEFVMTDASLHEVVNRPALATPSGCMTCSTPG